MKHFSFVYFSMLLHDSGEGCSHFVLQGRLTHCRLLCCFMKSLSTNGDFGMTVMKGRERQVFFLMSQNRRWINSWLSSRTEIPPTPIHINTVLQHIGLETDFSFLLFAVFSFFVKPSTPLTCSHISNWVTVWIFMILHDNFPLFHVKTYVNSEICSFKTILYSSACLPLLLSP